jgi:hypothetical protein
MKFKNILFFSTLLLNLLDLHGQNQKPKDEDLSKLSFKERLTFNVGGGIMFGNTYSNIHLQPQVGYRVTPKFTTGIGANFQYYRNTYLSNSAFLIYGGNAFARYKINASVFAQTEYQMLNFQQNWGQYALIGGGYTPTRGIYVSAYYLLLYPSNNIYNAPYVVRMGFMF